MDMINLLVVVRLAIEVLDTINMVLSPNNLRSNTFLITNHQGNHLSHHIRVMGNFFNHILTKGITILICILIIRLMTSFLPLSFITEPRITAGIEVSRAQGDAATACHGSGAP